MTRRHLTNKMAIKQVLVRINKDIQAFLNFLMKRKTIDS